MKTVKTYECKIEDFFEPGVPLISNHAAVTPAKARYDFWRSNEDFLVSYKECFKFIKSKSLGNIRPEQFFTDYDNFKKMCQHRKIDFANQGMIVDVSRRKGWIVGSNSSMNLDVLFEGCTHVSNCHPTWETTYYDNKMNVIKDFKNK